LAYADATERQGSSRRTSGTNGTTRLIGGSADTIYIPGRHRQVFMDTLALFLSTDCFLEIATPTVVHLVNPPEDPILYVDHVRVSSRFLSRCPLTSDSHSGGYGSHRLTLPSCDRCGRRATRSTRSTPFTGGIEAPMVYGEVTPTTSQTCEACLWSRRIGRALSSLLRHSLATAGHSHRGANASQVLSPRCSTSSTQFKDSISI